MQIYGRPAIANFQISEEEQTELTRLQQELWNVRGYGTAKTGSPNAKKYNRAARAVMDYDNQLSKKYPKN
jgi:hypothetical protein